MAYSIIFLPLVILAILLCISLPIFLGVFVYQDAKARGMEPLLWALIAVLAPSFIGLIIYLVVRRDHVILHCPSCGGEVQENFASCPRCGQKLNANCGHCGATLRPEWKLCPQCGTEITEIESFTPPVVNQGAGSKKLLAVVVAILLIPVVLLAVVIGGAVMFNAVTDSGVVEEVFDDNLARDVFYDLTDYEDYRVMSVSKSDLGEEAENWVKKCKAGKKGIFAKTYYRTQNGDFKGVQGSGTYDLTYAYTVIVINDDVLYDSFGEAGFTHYGDEEFMLTEDIRQEFVQVVKAKDIENAKEYDNVFVLRFPSGYDIDVTFTGGITDQMTAEMESQSLDIVLTGDTSANHDGGDMTYTIPFEGEYYSPLKVKKVTIVDKED